MKEKDDNDWTSYIYDYMHQIIQVYRDKQNEFFFTRGDVEFPIADEGLGFKVNLHSNMKEVYNTAYYLNPQSILEVGCGGCYHLKGLNIILPNSEIHGCDISQVQIDFGKWFSQLPPEIEENIFLHNVAQKELPRQYDLVFTNAVVMHQSNVNAICMMMNMKKASKKYILLIENPDHHGGEFLWRTMVKTVFIDCDISYKGHFIENAVLITK